MNLWFCLRSLQLFPNGNGYGVPDHLALFLGAYNPKSLRLGWKRRINLFFVFLTQSGKELDRSNGNYLAFATLLVYLSD